MGSRTLQTLQCPILLLAWVCFRGGGFPNPSNKHKKTIHRSPHGAGGPPVGCHVSNHALTRAGAVTQVTVEVAGLFGGEPVEYTPECVPGPVDLTRCLVDWSAAQGQWVAGEWVEIRVQRCDRFGNVVRVLI
jgi:hypothetical protein